MSREANEQLIYSLVGLHEKASITGSIEGLDLCMTCGQPAQEVKSMLAGSYGDSRGKQHKSYLVYGSCQEHIDGTAETSVENLMGRSVRVEIGPLTDAPAESIAASFRRSIAARQANTV